MSVKEVIQIESETATGEPVRIPFEFADRSSIPEGKNPGDCIIIKPITLRTWFKLKPLLVMIEQKDIDLLTAKEGVEFDSETAKVIFKYSELLFEIVCLGIRNRKGEMPEWFKDVLKDNCTWHDIYILLNAILFRIRFNSFSSSIILAKSVSPQSEEEIIALQENKMTWNPNQPSCS